MKSAETKSELMLKCKYGDISIGEENAGTSVTVNREHLPLEIADEYLCGKRLEAVMTVGPLNPDPKLFDDDEPQPRLAATVDIKRFGVTRKDISFRVVCMIDSIDIETFAHFSKQEGEIGLDLVGDIAGKGIAAEPDAAPAVYPEKPVSGEDEYGQHSIMCLERKELTKLLGSDPGAKSSLTSKKAEELSFFLDGVTVTPSCIADLEYHMVDVVAAAGTKLPTFNDDWIERMEKALILFRKKFPKPERANDDIPF